MSTRNFPYGGSLRDNPIEVVILCHSQEHLEKVTKAFPVENAYYTTIYANPAGIRLKKIVAFADFDNPERFTSAMLNWRTRLMPGQEKEVYVV
jgi:hypothetical protein